MRILIVGALGQLGQDLKNALHPHDLVTPERSEMDVTSHKQVMDFLEQVKPDVMVNTSAYHDVPKCEENPESAFAVNSTGALNLALACEKHECALYHTSTDYVFSGDAGRPYTEKDTPSPLMVYGASKPAGEHLALANCERTFIIRTTGLFGKHPCRAKPGGRNFVDTMLHLARERDELKVVDDLLCCPTYTPDLAVQISKMISSDIPRGIYHAVTPGGCSWYEFAKLIFKMKGIDVKVTPVSSDAFPASFRRPADSRMKNLALESAGIETMRPLGFALADYLEI